MFKIHYVSCIDGSKRETLCEGLTTMVETVASLSKFGHSILYVEKQEWRMLSENVQSLIMRSAARKG